ncbi:MAG TPA: threonine-phosphate decarboxylase CobD [bacterium]|nr:threonine-phosphate decarboxylase CobD [bacterium]
MIEHGGNIYRFARILDREPSTLIDFSANINPLGFPEGLKEHLFSLMDYITSYPDPEYVELRDAIAGYVGVRKENIIPGNGAIEMIYLYMKAMKKDKVFIPVPTFSEYERIARMNSLAIEYLFTKNFSIDVERLVKEISPESILIICNPNNPTGTLISIDSIEYLLEKLSGLEISLMIDEAFIEFTEDYPESSAVRFINSYPNLFIVRCFTKFFGIPGLRLGYGVGGEETVNKMKEFALPWSVNILADISGRYVLKNRSFMEETRRVITLEREFLLRELSNIKWIYPYPGKANFILARLSIDTEELENFLLQRGILIRNCRNFKGLDKSYIRIAVKDHSSNVKLVEALKSF